MKFAQALRAAKALGYTGAETPEALQAWLAHPDQADAAVTVGTKTYKANEIKIEAETKSARTAVIEEPTEVKGRGGLDELPADFQAKVEASAKAMLEKAGLIDTSGKALQRPGMIDTGGRITVKSGFERIYEDRVKSGAARFSDANTAYGFAKWFAARYWRAVGDSERYETENKKWMEWQGQNAKAMTSTSATAAGPLVPDQFIPDLIRNVNDVGDFSALVTPFQMGAQSIQFPRRTGGNTAYFQAEASAGTQSNPTYDNVELNAKTLIALTIVSQQLIDDSNVGVIDKLMEELAYSIADKIDSCFFVGDGSDTYGGITGIARKFGVTATGAARVSVGGATSDVTTQAEVLDAWAKVPRYARQNMKIACSPQIQAYLFERLSESTPGGLLRSEIVNDSLVQKFMGVPIYTNNYMNTRKDASSGTHPAGFTAGDDIDFIIGNWDRTILFGQRLSTELAMDTSRGFDAYAVYCRAISRFDINCYDASTTTGGLVAHWQT